MRHQAGGRLQQAERPGGREQQARARPHAAGGEQRAAQRQANTADAIPNAPAQAWNTSRDISALVTWKFIPNVDTKKTHANGIHSSGLAPT